LSRLRAAGRIGIGHDKIFSEIYRIFIVSALAF